MKIPGFSLCRKRLFHFDEFDKENNTLSQYTTQGRIYLRKNPTTVVYDFYTNFLSKWRKDLVLPWFQFLEGDG